MYVNEYAYVQSWGAVRGRRARCVVVVVAAVVAVVAVVVAAVDEAVVVEVAVVYFNHINTIV